MLFKEFIKSMKNNVPIFAVTGLIGYNIYSYYKNSLIMNDALQILDDRDKKDKKKMIILNNWPFHDEILRYLCVKYGDQIISFNYSTEKIYHFNEWRFRRKEKPIDLKIFMPNECELDIVYNKIINIKGVEYYNKAYDVIIKNERARLRFQKNLKDDFETTINISDDRELDYPPLEINEVFNY